MSTSEGSASADSMEGNSTGVPRARRSKGIEFNFALVIATFLDPRRKEDYLDFFYCKVSTNEEQISKQVEIALEWVRKYVKEYELLAATSTAHSTPSSQDNTTIGSPIAGKRQLEEEFSQYKSRRRSRVHKSELDVYLEEACEEDGADFDVLAWWKRHAKKFPILASMVRDFLSIPLSTVASESAFSHGGRILGDTRSSLNPDMLQALVCAKVGCSYQRRDKDSRTYQEGSLGLLGKDLDVVLNMPIVYLNKKGSKDHPVRPQTRQRFLR